jgi:predicted DNA repair protein MutK
MPASGLLALVDDLGALLDDVALLSRVAARKTAGVIGDDLALNAEQVTGMRADRELPVIWAVAKGALLNKVLLVPAALLISAWMPRAITPLLMAGGLFLCFEGFEKAWEKLRPETPEHAAERAARVQAVADPAVDVVAFEKARVRGAVRTDFILSAEIIVIALGTMADRPIGQQVAALATVALGVTVLVYGLVAGLVKLDDLGLRLRRGRTGGAAYAFGTGLLRGTPWLMKGLSVAGTVAMFLVGGGILAHGLPPVEHFLERVGATGPLRTLADGLVGVVAGGVVVGVVHLVHAVRSRRAAQRPAAPAR